MAIVAMGVKIHDDRIDHRRAGMAEEAEVHLRIEAPFAE
jgi:hypothetical protein